MTRRTLIANATIITMDPDLGDFRSADLLIEDGAIVKIAPTIDASEAERVDGSGKVLLPGFADSHRHLWYTPFRGDVFDDPFPSMFSSFYPRVASRMTADDVRIANHFGALDALDNGVTSVLDWCHIINTPEHADAAVDGLQASGIRARFFHGVSMNRKLAEYVDGNSDEDDSWDSARRVFETSFKGGNSLLSFGLAVQGPEVTSMEVTARDIAVARELGVPISIHVGAPQGGHAPRLSVQRLADAGLLGSDMNFAHCCDTTDEEFALIAEAGASVTLCPTSEAVLGMGTPPTGRLMRAGVPLAIGVDSAVCASTDMFDEMRATLVIERALRAEKLFDEQRAVTTREQLGLSARHVLEAATINGARAISLDRQVGSLSVGKRADIVMLDARKLSLWPGSDMITTLVGFAHGGDIDGVLVDGEFVKRDGVLAGVDLDRVRSDVQAVRDRLFAEADYPGLVPV
jgi:cytosine/adenosine deaminase-related metal-dependent hydrolase